MTEDGTPLPNEEWILRRISENVHEAKARHFKLRKDIQETGISCNSESLLVKTSDLLVDARPEAWLARASVRSICDIGLKVVIKNDPNSLGHCEIQSHIASLDDIETRDCLAKLFRPVAAKTVNEDTKNG